MKKKVKRYDLAALERAARIRKMPGFKVIVAGSRHFDERRCRQLLKEHWDAACEMFGQRPDYILSGACPTGADRAGEIVAKKLTGRRSIKFPPNWDLLGKAAGIHRNLDMVSCAHGLFIIWDGKSRGSSHVLGCMEVRGRPVYEIEISR